MDRYQSVPRASDDDSDEHMELHELQQKAGALSPQASQRAQSAFSRFRRDRKSCLRPLLYALTALFVVAVVLAAGRSTRLRQSLAGNSDGLESLLGPIVDREEGFT